MNKDQKNTSENALRRMPTYLNYLKKILEEGNTVISTPKIARDLDLNEVQVKKDLAYAATTSGKPKVGHKVENLIHDLEEYLGYNDITNAVIVGVGHLGKALLAYKEFESYGLKIIMAFDNNEKVIGKVVNGVEVYPINQLENLCKGKNIKIGIITVNESSAQLICDKLVDAEIEAIWNFATVKLISKNNVIIQNENMAASLAVLSRKLSKK